MVRISIIGCGTIGTGIAIAIDKKIIPAKLVSIYDKIPARAINLKNKLRYSNPKISDTLSDAIKNCDLVVESASQNAVYEIAKVLFCSINRATTFHPPDIFVMSVGALVVYPEIFQSAKKHNCKIYFPSGAIVGLDGIHAAKIGKIKSATLTTRKSPGSLGLKEKIKQEKTVFEGSAKEAVKKFPANINVSATLSIAGIGTKKTKVKIIADPKIKTNLHEIEVVGNFGKIFTRTENIPSKTNPKTSYLAVLSAIAYLKHLCEN